MSNKKVKQKPNCKNIHKKLIFKYYDKYNVYMKAKYNVCKNRIYINNNFF